MNKISGFIFLAFSGTFLSSQQLDLQDIAYNELRDIVETASRSQQIVWLEDFTGIDWPYCPAVSFAIDRLLNEYPQTLMTIEWHSDALTTSDTIDFPIPEAYSFRASLYDVNWIPHNQFNGMYSFYIYFTLFFYYWRNSFRHIAKFFHCLCCSYFYIKPNLIFVFFRPNICEFFSRVSWYHYLYGGLE